MAAVAAPTGRLSQQAAPSRHGAVLVAGGYLLPLPPVADGGGATPPTSDNGHSNAKPTPAVTGPDAAAGLVERIVAPVVTLPATPRLARLQPIQSWEGIVTDVRTDEFDARLFTVASAGRPEEATIPKSDIAQGDLELVAIDAVFYWTIGYLTTDAGQRSRISTIRFRRLPAWTQRELDEAGDRVAATRALLEWE